LWILIRLRKKNLKACWSEEEIPIYRERIECKEAGRIGCCEGKHSDLQASKFDSVVKSPIYCVAAIFQELDILHVLPRP